VGAQGLTIRIGETIGAESREKVRSGVLALAKLGVSKLRATSPR
jgi:hypothetical protein